MHNLIVLVGILLATTHAATSTTSSDHTDLLSRDCCASAGGGMTNVLVVTTTVGMLDWVHGDTTDLGPRVALDAVLVECTASLEHRLVDTATSGNDANGGAAGLLVPLLSA